MSSGETGARPMVSVTLAPEYRIRIAEPCGIAHERQVLEVALPEAAEPPSPQSDGSAPLLLLIDRDTDRSFPVQRSRADPAIGFLLIEIAPGEILDLGACRAGELPGDIVQVTLSEAEDGSWLVANGRIALRLAGKSRAAAGDSFERGPVLGVRCLPDGGWRGSTAFDTRRPLGESETSVIEWGPLRVVIRYRATFGDRNGSVYEATFTLDAGAEFVRITERWDNNTPGEQIVWDFSGDDLPAEILRLNATAGCAVETMHYMFDHRICRLFAWTQQSQLSDLSDGFALTFGSGEDAVGFLTLDGGSWRGCRLNHLEAWSRRWIGNDPNSRRAVPAAAKSDVFPSVENIPARGESRTTPHVNIEGWIGESGERTWALLAARTAELLPGAGTVVGVSTELGFSVASGHFELSPDRERDRRDSSRLRRLQTQRGLLPLARLANAVFDWPASECTSGFSYPNPVIEEHIRHRDKEAPAGESSEERERRRKRQMIESLAARVYGFWEGGGSAATNPVVSRDIAPRMLQYEYLAKNGLLTPAEDRVIRAHFAFMACLFESDTYYPGPATMLPAGHPDSVEPTLEGMANQNFYTDVVKLCGMAAQVFPNHPAAERWRARFGDHWARQMEYHMYPESGVWEESHTYYQHVLHTVLPTLLRRKADGVDDGFAHPMFHSLVSGAVRQITPRDQRFGGRRYLAPFGDHSAAHAAFAALYKPLAEAIAPHDPKLAGNLAWMYREMLGDQNLSVTPAAPRLDSEYVEGLGYFLRGHDAEGAEFLLALRSGSAWGHHHHDDGSIQFWAKGLSLIVDAGFGEWAAGKRKFNDSGHSRWRLTDYPAMNFLNRFNRGWLLANDNEALFAYAVAHAPTYLQAPSPGTVVPLPGQSATHRRAVVRVGPCAFVVIDVAETSLGQTVSFHIPATDRFEVVPGGIRAGYGQACRLSLLSVLPDQAPLAVITTDELQEGKSTNEISAPISVVAGRSRSAFLIVADSGAGDPAPRVFVDNSGGIQLTGHGFDVGLDWSERRRVRLTELSNGPERGSLDERVIDLSRPARYVH